jgi:hypothetical protein
MFLELILSSFAQEIRTQGGEKPRLHPKLSQEPRGVGRRATQTKGSLPA